MAATYTDLLRLLLQETYSNPETWGEEQNAGFVRMVDEAFGVVTVVVDGNVTLTAQNAVSDQARRMGLRFTGTGGFNVVAPALAKLYLLINQCSAPITLKTSVTAGVVIRANTAVWGFFDGTNWNVVDPTLDKIKPPTASVDMNGQKITNAAPGVADTDVPTLVQIQPFAVAAAASAAEAADTLDDVELLYNLFGDLFLGAKTSNPATDNQGDPLVVGALYFNTVANELRVYNGTAWQGGVTDTANLVAKMTVAVATSTTAALDGYAYYVDTSGGAFTLTLPAAAAEGVKVGVSCGSSVETNNLTINPNSQTFDGATTSFTVRIPCTLLFRKTSSEWRLEP